MLRDTNGTSDQTFIGFYEDDADKVVGCTPVILNQLHANKLRECIKKIPLLKNSHQIEKNFEQFNYYLAIYSSEPRLLDSVLPEFVDSLVKLIDFNRNPDSRFSAKTEETFRYLKTLALLCSYKLVASLLSHEVAFLEKLLSALEYYVHNVKESSHIIYFLQLWLYIVCKNPFDLARLSKEHDLIGTGLDALSQRLIKILLQVQLTYNTDTNFYRLTPNLLAQILTRNKDNSAVLKPLINQAITVLQTEESGTMLRAYLSLLSSVFKFGKRTELLEYADEVFVNIRMSIFDGHEANFASKLYQRLALVFLPPKLATWRYKRGYRSLEANLTMRQEGQQSESAEPTKVDQATDTEALLEMHNIETVPKLLETFLLLIRNDSDAVRTTAAKALGRICARLPKNQTDFVIQRILKDNFSDYGTASTWHGGCLVLAEMSGRGCFLPEHLNDVVPIICDALLYDKQCNGNTTEANVRDAACYICWSFARAYGLDVLNTHATLLAQRLICTALFDREVNVRRAASASFQENVGRHGGFAHGIQVLIITDFVGVGKIRYCYEQACVQVAQYEEYRRSILDHLCQLKCVYWDEKVRLLAAIAIKKLVPLDKEYAFETLLPYLCANLKESTEFDKMQGYLMAISALVSGLGSDFNNRFKQLSALQDVCTFVLERLSNLSQFSLKGFGYLIKASCNVMKTILATDLVLKADQLNQFIGIFEHTLEKTDESIRECSADALSAIFAYCDRNGHAEILFSQLQKYLKTIQKANSEVVQISCILSLNCLPQGFFDGNENGAALLVELFNCFSQVILSPISEKWYLSRIYALKSQTCLIQLSPVKSFVDHNVTFACLFKCIIDRTKTDHGDVGRYVREAALVNLKSVLQATHGVDQKFEEHLDKSVALVLQRCSDTVDKTRATAIQTMIGLLDSNFNIKELNRLREIFTSVDANVLKGVDFLPLEHLLDLMPYRRYLLCGLLPSMGSILPWTAKHSQDILAKHLHPIKNDIQQMESFVKELIEIGEEFAAQDEFMALLFFNALQRIISDGLFIVFEADPDGSQIFRQLCEFVQEASRKKSKPKLRHALIRTLGSFLILKYDSEVAQQFRCQLISILASPYNSLRSIAAEQLTEALDLTKEEVFNRPNVQQAITLLGSVNWDEQIDSETFREPAIKINDLLK